MANSHNIYIHELWLLKYSKFKVPSVFYFDIVSQKTFEMSISLDMYLSRKIIKFLPASDSEMFQ